MADVELETKSTSLTNTNFQLCSQIVLRSLVISSTLASALLILNAKQSVTVFGIPIDARYSYSPAYKFFAFANSIASAFSLLSLCFVFVSSHRGTPKRNFIVFFLHDLLMLLLLLAGCSAATAIGYVGKFGNTHTGWSPICDHFTKFCNRVTVSVAVSYFAVLCLLLLTIISANPPLVSR